MSEEIAEQATEQDELPIQFTDAAASKVKTLLEEEEK